MRRQVLLAIEDVEQHGVQQIVIAFFRIIFDNDIFQFLQLQVYLVVMAGKGSDVILIRKTSLQQSVHVGEYRFVFIFHMPTHFLDIFVIELKDKKSHIVGTGAVDGFNQFATDGRQVEIEKIEMCPLQIIHKRRQRKIIAVTIAISIRFPTDKIDHSQERAAVHPLGFTDFFHIFIAETQGQTKTAHHHQ